MMDRPENNTSQDYDVPEFAQLAADEVFSEWRRSESADTLPTKKAMTDPVSKAIERAGESLTKHVLADLPELQKQLTKHGLPTKDVDALIVSKNSVADAAKPLQKALIGGDFKGLQKILSQTKPEQLREMAKLLQDHADAEGYGFSLDVHEGNKLIFSSIGKDRAIVVGADTKDVIGVNIDGSYDFSKQFRGENAEAELISHSRSVASRVAGGHTQEITVPVNPSPLPPRPIIEGIIPVPQPEPPGRNWRIYPEELVLPPLDLKNRPR